MKGKGEVLNLKERSCEDAEEVKMENYSWLEVAYENYNCTRLSLYSVILVKKRGFFSIYNKYMLFWNVKLNESIKVKIYSTG